MSDENVRHYNDLTFTYFVLNGMLNLNSVSQLSLISLQKLQLSGSEILKFCGL